MSRAGRFLFLFSFLFFLVLCAARIIYGGWENGMWAPLGFALVFFILGLVKEGRNLIRLFSLRTTKHGLNLGVIVLLVIAGLTCVNILAVRYEKKFDWTEERLNSLSDQSRKAALALPTETKILLLYRKAAGEENVARAVADLASMYTNVNKKIVYEAFNILQRPDLANKYEIQGGSYATFVVQNDRKIKVDTPNEEGLTRAFLKLARDKKKTIYFTMGHGERVLDDKSDAGLSSLKQDLSVTYDVKPLVLFDVKDHVPEDASLVAIVRPTQQFLETELQGIRDYAKHGGHVLIAIDPGLKHNLALLTKSFGVEFANNFILDLRSQGGGPATVLGTEFSTKNDITKSFTQPNTFAVFFMVSELKVDPNKPASFTVQPIVRSENTMSIPEPTEQVNFKPNGPHLIGAVVEGKWPSAGNDEKASEKDFAAVIFGDSDFMANSLLATNLNRDLALNSFSWLASDKDLISIRPKEPKATKLEMTAQDYYILLFCFPLPLPFLFFIGGGVIWWRRKAA